MAVKGVRLGQAALVVERPAVPAADPSMEAVFAARAALKRAYSVRRAAQLQVDQLRALVSRLEGERRPCASEACSIGSRAFSAT